MADLLDTKPIQDLEALRQERVEKQLETIADTITWLIGVRQGFDDGVVDPTTPMKIGIIT